MLISRFALEVTTACATSLLGIAVSIGSTEFGISWSDSGPEPGYFPFFVGVLLTGASIGNLVTALVRHRTRVPFIDRGQARRILLFVVPMAGFILATIVLGLYVGTALYLSSVMRVQGGYRLSHSLAVGVGVALLFYFMFDVWFRVPLLKGPLESLLGIY